MLKIGNDVAKSVFESTLPRDFFRPQEPAYDIIALFIYFLNFNFIYLFIYY